MDQIVNIYKWVIIHKEELALIWASIVTIASIIIKMIPPLPENNPLLPFVKFIGKYLALNTNAPTSRPE